MKFRTLFETLPVREHTHARAAYLKGDLTYDEFVTLLLNDYEQRKQSISKTVRDQK
jgi:hypothetical protein